MIKIITTKRYKKMQDTINKLTDQKPSDKSNIIAMISFNENYLIKLTNLGTQINNLKVLNNDNSYKNVIESLEKEKTELKEKIEMLQKIIQ